MRSEKKGKSGKVSGERVTEIMDNEKTCCDCLYCKVSRKSIAIRGLCFCDKKRQIKEKTVKYWLKKNLCRLFDDMSA